MSLRNMEYYPIRISWPSTALFTFSLVFLTSWSHAEIRTQPTRYPLEIHRMFRDTVSKGKVMKTEGVWSSWSTWTPCSRTCGGGVTMQTRECISRPADLRVGRGRRRKRLETNDVSNQCVGLYKRYHLCNPQPCPPGRDFRAEQCAVFNARPFRGQIYFWEPYVKAGECALNCRAIGMGFYAQLNRTVWDGTPCGQPTTALLQPAPAGTRGVCVSGACKSVSNEGVIGAVTSARVPELCSECSGGCKSESLFFLKPILSPGYTFVDTIPKGACRVSVSQLKHTRNYIALRYTNGTYFLNGDKEVTHRHEILAAGTVFNYRRQDASSLESVVAKGPLGQPIEIMLLYHQPNPGVKYEYMIPADQAVLPSILDSRRHIITTGGDARKPESGMDNRRVNVPFVSMINQQADEIRPLVPHRRRRRKFAWKIVGMTPCSKTCGGGTKHPKVACIREHTQTAVLDRRCAGIERPYNHSVNCNTQPCPGYYWGDNWSACSTTCGPGEQTRIPICFQEIGPKTMIVDNEYCSEPRPPSFRKCEITPCEMRDNELEQELPTAAQWHTGGWSQCSVTCGNGQRTRSVTCSGQCRPQDRPASTEKCRGPVCPLISVTSHKLAPTLLHHNAAAPHGAPHRSPPMAIPIVPSAVVPSSGTQTSLSTYLVASSSWLMTDWTDRCSEECGTGTQTRWVVCPTGECNHGNKPESTRACSSDKQCGGMWYTGPWGPCSDSCGGVGRQKREVLCIVHIRTQIRVVSEMTCSLRERPESEQTCEGTCHPRWFTSEWTACDCPGGLQRREVRCLQWDGRYATGCLPAEMPAIKRTCQCQADYRYREITHAQDEPSVDGNCVDSIPNCTIIIQGRMCLLPSYYKQCCASCRRAQQSPRE